MRRGSLPGGKGGDKGGVITKGKGVTKMKLTPTAKYSMCRPYMLAAKLYLHEGNKRKQHVVHNFKTKVLVACCRVGLEWRINAMLTF